MAFSTTQRLPLTDVPRFIDTSAAKIAADPIWVISQLIETANYLNWYARRQTAHTSMRNHYASVTKGCDTTTLWVRADDPDYTGRKVHIGVVGFPSGQATGPTNITITHVNSATSVNKILGSTSDIDADSLYRQWTDKGLYKIVVPMPVTSNDWNEYTITYDNGADGPGAYLKSVCAYELPPSDGGDGAQAWSADGLQFGNSSVIAGADDFAVLADLAAGNIILASTIAELMRCVDRAWRSNRPCLFCAGEEGDGTVTPTLTWRTNSPADYDTFVNLPSCGIPIVGSPVRSTAHGKPNKRNVRAYLYIVANASGGGAVRLLASDSSTSATTTFAANSADWYPIDIEIPAATTVDELYVQLKATDDPASDPRIHAIQLFETEPTDT